MRFKAIVEVEVDVDADGERVARRAIKNNPPRVECFGLNVKDGGFSVCSRKHVRVLSIKERGSSRARAARTEKP